MSSVDEQKRQYAKFARNATDLALMETYGFHQTFRADLIRMTVAAVSYVRTQHDRFNQDLFVKHFVIDLGFLPAIKDRFNEYESDERDQVLSRLAGLLLAEAVVDCALSPDWDIS